MNEIYAMPLRHNVPQHRERECEGVVVWVRGLSELRSVVPASWRGRRFYSLVAVLDLVQKRTFARGGDVFWPVGRDSLAKVVGSESARRALMILSDAGFIERDETAVRGKQCYGARLSSYAARLPLEREVLPAAIAKRAAFHERERVQSALSRHPAHRYVWASLQSVTLHEAHARCAPRFSVEVDVQARRAAHWEFCVSQIEQRNWHFSCDRTAGRLHHNVTGMPRELRGFVLLDGMQCVETDIACCQPLLMHRLYPRTSVESKRFAELVSSGQFYEEIGRASGCVWADRQGLKRSVFSQVLYGRVRPDAPTWRAFENLFPELAHRILEIKRDGYWKLAVENQRIEADIVVRTVVARLAVELPGVPVLTVHDSLVVPRARAEEAQQILRDEVHKATGVAPLVTLKSETLR
jgi:hypothetical protein